MDKTYSLVLLISGLFGSSSFSRQYYHVEKKSVKKYLVRLKVSFVGNPDLSYRGVLLDNILQQMRKMLEKQRISGGTDLSWRDSNVLQPEKKMENIQEESLILTS
ncbi:hypothetical protein AOLI_G00217060 [Acnodon oligacanthus]